MGTDLMIPPDTQPKNHTADFKEYFQNLGYDISWDFSRSRGEEWNEILLEDGTLVCQIDTGVPLTDIIEDFLCWHFGKDATSKSDYICSTGQGDSKDKNFKKLLKKVYEKETQTNESARPA